MRWVHTQTQADFSAYPVLFEQELQQSPDEFCRLSVHHVHIAGTFLGLGLAVQQHVVLVRLRPVTNTHTAKFTFQSVLT